MTRTASSGTAVFATLASVVSLAIVVSNRAMDDWPQWRGPNRDGISAERGLLKSWPQNGPPLAWQASGAGEGYSSFAVANGRLYTLGARGGSEYVIAYDAASGKRLWETAHGRRFDNDRGGGPRATPTVEGNRLYAFGASGDLTAMDAASDLPARTASTSPATTLLNSPPSTRLPRIERLRSSGSPAASRVASSRVNWRSCCWLTLRLASSGIAGRAAPSAPLCPGSAIPSGTHPISRNRSTTLRSASASMTPSTILPTRSAARYWKNAISRSRN